MNDDENIDTTGPDNPAQNANKEPKSVEVDDVTESEDQPAPEYQGLSARERIAIAKQLYISGKDAHTIRLKLGYKLQTIYNMVNKYGWKEDRLKAHIEMDNRLTKQTVKTLTQKLALRKEDYIDKITMRIANAMQHEPELDNPKAIVQYFRAIEPAHKIAKDIYQLAGESGGNSVNQTLNVTFLSGVERPTEVLEAEIVD